ncbi:protein-disulfide reductase DsbD domain-containing protein [Candidatus Latescibacterota bacterium]
MFSKKLIYWLIIFNLIPPLAFGQAKVGNDLIKIKGITSLDKIHPGIRFQIAIIIDISEGWYLNAHCPFDETLISTDIRFENESGLTFSDIIYPDPIIKSFRFSDQKLAVYEGEVIIGSRVSVSKKFTAKELVISGRLTYQACNNDMCLIPIEVEINIPLEIAGLEQRVHRINDALFSPLEARWANVHYNRGKSYEVKGLINEAILECEEAILLKPNNLNYLFKLSMLHFRKGNYDKAITIIKKAEVLNPKDESIQMKLKEYEEMKNR